MQQKPASCDTDQINFACCLSEEEGISCRILPPPRWAESAGAAAAIDGVRLLLLEGMEWGSDFRDGFGREELLLSVPVVLGAVITY